MIQSIYGTQNATIPPAVQSEVAESLSSLESAIMRLEGFSHDLVSRLEPVMRPEMIAGCTTNKPENAPVVCPVSGAIKSNAAQIDIIATRLSGILNRLCV